MKRRDLERALEAVADFPAPRAEWEQYRTPAPVAADLLWQAAADGALAGKRVLDLGCGTGMFALGATLLGAAEVVGVDKDPAAVQMAREAVPTATFRAADVADWTPDAADTALMNPPFGAQKANRGGDRIFYDKAAEAVAAQNGSAWFLAQLVGERFLTTYAHELGGTLERVAQWDYPIKARFAFHDKEVASIHVAGYRMGFD